MWQQYEIQPRWLGRFIFVNRDLCTTRRANKIMEFIKLVSKVDLKGNSASYGILLSAVFYEYSEK